MKKNLVMIFLTALFSFIGTQGMSAVNTKSQHQQVSANWKDFHSAVGKCTLKFPTIPEHITEKLNMPQGEGYELKYDAYISSNEKKNVYMLLIAQYPEFVDQSFAAVSLEGFLNGILANNPKNQLLFADLLLVQGHEALDFFIKNGNVYFKGRAIMVNNNLYLMAMECQLQDYDEKSFDFFINSFQLHK